MESIGIPQLECIAVERKRGEWNPAGLQESNIIITFLILSKSRC